VHVFWLRARIPTCWPCKRNAQLDYTLSLQVTNADGVVVDHADTKMKLTDYFEENGWVYVYQTASINLFAIPYVYVRMYVYMCVYVCVCAYIMCVCVWYAYIMCVCLCVYIYMYIYTYVHALFVYACECIICTQRPHCILYVYYICVCTIYVCVLYICVYYICMRTIGVVVRSTREFSKTCVYICVCIHVFGYMSVHT
jgi:hypothetical protein